MNNYEVINGKMIIADQWTEHVVFVLSMFKGTLCFFIIIIWFSFRYGAIRKIEKEKFMLKDPGIDPDTWENWIEVSIFASIIYQDAALNFILHF
jgi:hypothetical protein